MNVAFRVDSSNTIGAGHITRCLRLAEELKYKSNNIIFISKNIEGNFNKLVKKKKFKLILIKKRLKNDLKFTKNICYKFKINLLVIDNYKLGSYWEKKIKQHVDKTVVLDDFTNKKHHCDFIINNLYKSYKNTQQLTGLEYVIIPNFLHQRKKLNLITKNRKKINIGTFFGSVDSHDCTEKFLKIFSKKEFIKMNFISILGEFSKNRNKIREEFKKFKNIHVEEKFIDMKNFFKKIDILITSGGVTSYEGLYHDVNCINIPINYYQKTNSRFQKLNKISEILNYNYLLKKKLNIKLIKLFKKILNKNNFKEEKLYLDEKGPQRIAETLIPSKFDEISIRKAKNLIDCVDLFKLRNDKENIINSFNQKKIKFNNHLKWFKKKLCSKKTFIYIFRINTLFVGQVRIDIKKNNVGIIDYSLDKVFRGRGWGSLMLAKALKENYKNSRVYKYKAKVKKRNINSIKIFQKLFFLKNEKKNTINFYKNIITSNLI